MARSCYGALSTGAKPRHYCRGSEASRNFTSRGMLQEKAVMKKLTLFPILFLGLLSGSGYKIVRTYPHDPGAYTQGLLYHDGFLYEGTGMVGRSSLRKVELTTGRVLQR